MRQYKSHSGGVDTKVICLKCLCKIVNLVVCNDIIYLDIIRVIPITTAKKYSIGFSSVCPVEIIR